MGKTSKTPKDRGTVILDAKGNVIGLGDKLVHLYMPGVFQITTNENFFSYQGEPHLTVFGLTTGVHYSLKLAYLLKYPKYLASDKVDAYKALAGFEQPGKRDKK